MSDSSLIAIILSALLISPGPMAGQQPVAGQPPAPAAAKAPAREASPPAAPTGRKTPGGLRILVLEGQNVINSVATKSAISPVVQVLDSLDQPVAGATVTFEVLPTGPGGTFGNAPVATMKTDFTGQATAAFTPNDTTGSFVIKVTAAFAGQTAQARIHQTNTGKAMEAMVQPPPRPWYKNWKLWAVIGAGAGAGLATALVLRDSSSSNNTITISPGTVVIGGQ